MNIESSTDLDEHLHVMALLARRPGGGPRSKNFPSVLPAAGTTMCGACRPPRSSWQRARWHQFPVATFIRPTRAHRITSLSFCAGEARCLMTLGIQTCFLRPTAWSALRFEGLAFAG